MPRLVIEGHHFNETHNFNITQGLADCCSPSSFTQTMNQHLKYVLLRMLLCNHGRPRPCTLAICNNRGATVIRDGNLRITVLRFTVYCYGDYGQAIPAIPTHNPCNEALRGRGKYKIFSVKQK